MKHTPGPWKIDLFPVDIVCKSGRIAMLDEENESVGDAELLHNAKLISRAPELEHLARDLVAMLFWQYKKKSHDLKLAERMKSNTVLMIAQVEETDAYSAFITAYDYLMDRTKGDE